MFRVAGINGLDQASFTKWGIGNFKIGNTADVRLADLLSLCRKINHKRI